MIQFLGRMYFRLRGNNNWVWVAFMLFTLLAFSWAIQLASCYFQAGPALAFEQARDELYRYEASLQGEQYTASSVGRSRFACVFAPFAFWFFGVLFITVLATFLPTFGDEARRVIGSVRMKLWDKYGSELATAGWIGRFVTKGIPAGVSPPKGQPITKKSYIVWEAIIGFLNEFLGFRLFGR